MKERIKVRDLLSWTGGKLISGNIEDYIHNISTDSRTLEEEDFFIPLTGENYNGHDFIKPALAKKACGFVFETEYKKRLDCLNENTGAGKPDRLIIIESENNLIFLENIARHYIRRFRPFVIGITGSAGKTTTKNFLVNILKRENEIEFTPKNYNTEIGVSKSILEVNKDTDFFIAELGMRGKGQIGMLADMCNLNLGVITAVGRSHMAFFNNLREIALAKAEMAETISKNNGVLLINNDDRYSSLIEKEAGCRVIKFGRNNNIAFNFTEKEMDNLGRFEFCLFKGSKKIADIKLNIPGYHNIYNACCAAAVALYLNISSESIKKGIEQTAAENSRMEIIEKQDKIIIDDCYNASPLSMKKAIDTLVLVSEKRGMRSVAILGDMLELGSNSLLLHRETGKYLSKKKVDMLIAVGELARGLYDGYRDTAGSKKNKGKPHYFRSKEKLKKELGGLLEAGDLILVKGSRAKKMEDIINLIE